MKPFQAAAWLVLSLSGLSLLAAAGTRASGAAPVRAARQAQGAPSDRAQLGVTLAPDESLEVLELQPEGPAQRAGIEAGDRIAAFGQTRLADFADLQRELAKRAPGETLAVRVRRECSVQLGVHPDGPATKGWLGVVIGEDEHGVRVLELPEGSPAGDAGLRANDVVVALDGKELTDLEAFTEAIGALAPLTRVALAIEREVDVVLGRRSAAGSAQPAAPVAPRIPPAQAQPGVPDRPGYLGVHLGETEDASGVRVTGVVPDSPAARAGVESGMLLRGVAGHAVASVSEVQRLVRALPAGSPIELAVVVDDASAPEGARELTLRAVLDERPAEALSIEVPFASEQIEAQQAERRRAMRMRELSSEYSAQMRELANELRELTPDGGANAFGGNLRAFGTAPGSAAAPFAGGSAEFRELIDEVKREAREGAREASEAAREAQGEMRELADRMRSEAQSLRAELAERRSVAASEEDALHRELDELRSEVSGLRAEIERLRAERP